MYSVSIGKNFGKICKNGTSKSRQQRRAQLASIFRLHCSFSAKEENDNDDDVDVDVDDGDFTTRVQL